MAESSPKICDFLRKDGLQSSLVVRLCASATPPVLVEFGHFGISADGRSTVLEPAPAHCERVASKSGCVKVRDWCKHQPLHQCRHQALTAHRALAGSPGGCGELKESIYFPSQAQSNTSLVRLVRVTSSRTPVCPQIISSAKAQIVLRRRKRPADADVLSCSDVPCCTYPSLN